MAVKTASEFLPKASYHGCQPTSMAFMKAASLMGIEQIFTSYNNPKGNAETERVFRTLKEEIIWTREYQSLASWNEQLMNGLTITIIIIYTLH